MDSISASQVLGLQVRLLYPPNIYMGVQDSNSGFHACMVSALPTEPSHQSTFFIFTGSRDAIL